VSRREEIQRRANEEFAEVLERCRDIRDELLHQQRVALGDVPAAAAALTAYEDAIARAFDVYRRALDDSERELAQQEGEAFGDHFSGDEVAGASWRDATQHAIAERAQALTQASEAHTAAHNLATALVGTERDRAIRAARREYEQASMRAEQKYVQDTDAAWRTFHQSTTTAREDAIAQIERARTSHRTRSEQAAFAHERAKDDATRALNAALEADTRARFIRRAFASRLEEAERTCEAEKQDVLTRMRRDLDAASRNG
jgi:hypothetical protein